MSAHLEQFAVADSITYAVLVFAIGLAISLALISAVLVLTGRQFYDAASTTLSGVTWRK